MSTDKRKNVVCDTCGGSLHLDDDQAVAAAQIITFIAAHSHRPGAITIRMQLDVTA